MRDLMVNTTKKYNPDHAYLDEWEVVATAEIKHGTVVDDEEGGYEQKITATLTNLNNEAAVERAIQDTYRRGCSCEWDCCGCPTGGAREFVWVTPGRVVKFTVSYRPNY